MVPLFNNPVFPLHFSWWLNKVLYCIGHLLDHRGICPPEYFGMPFMESFRLNQILQVLWSLKSSTEDITTRMFYETTCFQDSCLWEGISMLYLFFSTLPDKLSYQQAWEMDLGRRPCLGISLVGQLEYTLNTTLVEANYKGIIPMVPGHLDCQDIPCSIPRMF